MAQLRIFCETYALTIGFCVAGAALVVPLLAFVTRHCRAPDARMSRLLQRILIVGGILGAILLLSDHCPFPGGLFHEDRPVFLGGWMIAAGVGITLVFLILAPPISFLIFYGVVETDDAGEIQGIGCSILILLVLWASSAWLIPFETHFGFLLPPITIHALRTTFLPWTGAIGFLVATMAWNALIYLRKTRNVFAYWPPVLLVAIFVSWTVHGVVNAWSLPGADIVYNKNSSPANALATATTFRHASDWIIVEEAIRQSRDAKDYAALESIAELVGNSRGEFRGTALLAVIAAAKDIESGYRRAGILEAVASGALRLDSQEGSIALQAVIAAAKEMGSSYARDDVLQAVASAAGEVGGREGLAVLQAVIAAVKENQNAHTHSYGLQACAEAAHELKQGDLARTCLADAVAAAEEIESVRARSSALQACAKTAQELGQRDLAFEFLASAVVAARQIEDKRDRRDALQSLTLAVREIPSAAAELGGREGLVALQTVIAAARVIEDSGTRSNVLLACAHSALELGQQGISRDCRLEALLADLAVARESEDGLQRTLVLQTVVSSAGELGGQEGLAALKAVIPATLELKDGYRPTCVLDRVASAAVELGGQEGLTALKAVIAASDRVWCRLRVGILIACGEAAQELKQRDLALDCLVRAVAAAKEDRWVRDVRINLKAVAYAARELGGPEGLTALQTVIGAARGIWGQRYDIDVLGAVARAAGELGGQEGLAALQAVIAAVKEIPYEACRSECLQAVASGAGELGGQEGLAALIVVIALAKEIDGATSRSDGLQACAKAAQELKQRGLALKCLVDAVGAAKDAEDEWHRTWDLRDIAVVAGELGGQEGTAALQAIIAVAKGIEEADDRNSVLRACARAAQKLEQGDLALKCLVDAAAAAKEIEAERSRTYQLGICVEVAKKLGFSLRD